MSILLVRKLRLRDDVTVFKLTQKQPWWDSEFLPLYYTRLSANKQFCFVLAIFFYFFLLLIPLNPNILHTLESNMKPLRQRCLALHKEHL